MDEQRNQPQGDSERVPDVQGWSELEAHLGRGQIDADLRKGQIKGSWWGDTPAVVVMTTVAMIALSFAEYAYLTVPFALLLGLATIFGLRLKNERNLSNPAQSVGEPGSQGQDRAPPVGD